MTKNNDGRLDHSDPIPDFIKSGIGSSDPIPDFIKSGKYRVFNFIFLFLFFCTGAVFASGSLPQIRYCLLMQRREYSRGVKRYRK